MARFSFFFLLASLLGAALANVPGHVYRADNRDPDKIKADGGFKSFGKNADSDISIVEHVTKQYDSKKKGHRQGQDPWISTSALSTIADQNTVTKPCWVYTIDTSAIASRFTDVATAFTAEGKTNPHAKEQEWAARLEIPLSAITSFYLQKKDGSKSETYTWTTWAARNAAKTAPADDKTTGGKKSPSPEPGAKKPAASTSNKPPTTGSTSQKQPSSATKPSTGTKTGKKKTSRDEFRRAIALAAALQAY